MILLVDGHDLSHLVVSGGYTVGRTDLEGPNAGRTMDGKAARDLITFKRKVEIKFRGLTAEEWRTVEHDILRGREWNTVTFEDFGIKATAKMYQTSFGGTIGTYTGLRNGAAVNFIEQ